MMGVVISGLGTFVMFVNILVIVVGIGNLQIALFLFLIALPELMI